jgi:hypothetical protein
MVCKVVGDLILDKKKKGSMELFPYSPKRQSCTKVFQYFDIMDLFKY